jgi:hypothetical protein
MTLDLAHGRLQNKTQIGNVCLCLVVIASEVFVILIV